MSEDRTMLVDGYRVKVYTSAEMRAKWQEGYDEGRKNADDDHAGKILPAMLPLPVQVAAHFAAGNVPLGRQMVISASSTDLVKLRLVSDEIRRALRDFPPHMSRCEHCMRLIHEHAGVWLSEDHDGSAGAVEAAKCAVGGNHRPVTS